MVKEKAYRIIMRSMEPALRASVADLDDPKAVLDKLKTLYGTPNASVKTKTEQEVQGCCQGGVSGAGGW